MPVSDYLSYFVVLSEFGVAPNSFCYVLEEILVFSSIFLLLFFMFHPSVVSVICQLLFSRSVRAKRYDSSGSQCSRKNKSSSTFVASTSSNSTPLENDSSPHPVKAHEALNTPNSFYHTLPMKDKKDSDADALIDGVLSAFFQSEGLLDHLAEKN